MKTATNKYPKSPGFKERGGTSEQAARAVAEKDPDHRALVLAAYREHGPMTADEAGEKVGLEPLQVRPRVAQLKKLGQVENTGAKRPSSGGSPSWVWRAVRPMVQAEMFA